MIVEVLLSELELDVDVLEVTRAAARELLSGRGLELSDRLSAVAGYAWIGAAAERAVVRLIEEIPVAERDWQRLGAATGLSPQSAEATYGLSDPAGQS